MSDRRDMNWKLADLAEEGYEDADIDASSDSGANILLAKISSGNRTTPVSITQRRRPSLMKLTTGAGKRKMSQPKKTIRANSRKRTTFENLTPTHGYTQSPTGIIINPNSTGSSSSSFFVKLKFWDGLIDEYFEDVSKNNAPISNETDNNVDVCVTGEQKTPFSEYKERTGPSVATHSSRLQGPSTSGSATEPIVMDNTPEETPPIVTQTRLSARPRSNVEPPQFQGERRYVDNLE